MLLKKNKPRFDYAVECAYDFIIENEIPNLPVDPFVICELNNWEVIPVDAFAKSMNKTRKYIIETYIQSKDGSVFFEPCLNQYKIIYNEYQKKNRIRWTITHEIGHIALHHLNDKRTSISRGGISDTLYDKYEKEADCFAGIILAPPIILKKMDVQNSEQIRNICNLTHEASLARFDYINNLYNFNLFKDYYPIILNQFYDFLYKKHCPICGHDFISENANYCPICGDTNLERGDSKMHYRKGIELDNNNHAIICPKCGNEDIKSADIRCPICNAYLIQECDDETYDDGYGNQVISAHRCGNKTMDSNARYCPKCGNKTTFYKYGYLEDWEVEREDIEREEAERQIAASSDEFIAPIADGDIPF